MKGLATYFLLLFSSATAFAQIGKVGINTISPAAMLHVKDSSVLFSGVYPLPALPGSPPVSGSGTRMMWYPDKSAFRAGTITSAFPDYWNKDNVGQYSFAMGSDTKASAYGAVAIGTESIASSSFAIAIGASNVASGYASTALGIGAQASAGSSLAMGISAVASGNSSTAIGYNTQSKSFAGTTVGSFNENADAANTTDFNPNNRIFQIGNGTASNARKNAMTVLQNGKVGINTTAPAAVLHVKDSSIVCTGVYPFTGAPGPPPVSGAGTRMMWYPDKAAFRVGTITSAYPDFWNKDNVGQYSIAMGSDTKASAYGAVAIGTESMASSSFTTAIGTSNVASGYASTAFGIGAQASAGSSIAIGISAVASGNSSTALGYYTQSKSFAGTTVGSFNENADAASTTDFNPNNRIFQIGNGTASNARKNALTVLQNGKVGINTTAPAAVLHVKDSSIVCTGVYPFTGAPGPPPVSGSGTRMMWYPDKSAFRAGTITSAFPDYWNKDNVGQYSIAMGSDTKATGFGAVAIGIESIASNSFTTAMGTSNVASGYASTAFGLGAQASAGSSIAIGISAVASGNSSTALGYYTQSKSFAGTTVGSFNENADAASTTDFNVNNRIFQIGNGTSVSDRKNAMTVLQNGNIGIGTTTPSLPLHVAKNTTYGVGGSYGMAATNSTNTNLRLNLGYDGAIDAAVIQASHEGNTFNKKLLLNPNGGNVGIGITAADYLLDVGGRIRLRYGGGETAGLWLNKNDNTAKAGFIGTLDDNYIGMYGESGAGWSFVMNTNTGNIGIGTTVPAEKLNVVGNGLFSGTVTASCGVLVCSDIRYKTNILPISNALGSLLTLHGIYYNWDREKFPERGFTTERQVGFSAQELEQVYPEMVKTDAAGYKTVDYSKLTPVLVEAIKEQQAQINQLKEQVHRLLNALDAQKDTKQ